ncbi:MAG: hypothetical protein E7556_02810 [Ruminococcaceae bacterium]|nr:hypothetical protein [Oscillospiraceae bacterium]
MENLFLTIVNMSITATWVVLAFTLLRPLLKKVPKWVNCFLWGIVALRLCLPFSLESVFSLIPTTETIPTNITTSAKPQIDTGVGVVNSVVNPVISESFTPDPSYSANPLQVIVGVASYIWLVGLVFMVLYCVISYIMLKRKVSASVHYNNNIYYCDNIETPFILGVIKPKIYIPSGVNESDLQFILEHEKSHIKRKDYLVKPLSFLILSVYWFNPAIWLWYILLCRDIESACDEKAIKFYDNEYKKLYSTALLNCSTQKRMIMACPVAFGETGVKQRIKSVLNYKQPAFWVVGFAIILTVWLTIFFVTNPENDKLEKILSEDCYQIINATEKKMSFEFMSSAIRPEMSEDGNYKVKSNPFVVNDFLELQFTELLSRDDRYTLTFKAEYQALPDEGTIYIVNANQFDGGLELGDKILLSDSSEVLNNEDVYVATCSSQGPGTEFSFSVPKIWFEDRQDNKIVVTLDMLEVVYKKIDSSEEEKTENYVYADENTGTLYRVKDNYYYGVINKNNYQNIGLFLKEVDGDNRFICDLNTSDISQSVVVDNTFYYKGSDFNLHKVELKEDAKAEYFIEELYHGDTYYSIDELFTVSGGFIYCSAKHRGLREEYPDWDLVFLKLNTKTEKYEIIDKNEIPKVDSDFSALVPEIEKVLNATANNIFVQRMNFNFESNGSFESGLITVQFYNKNSNGFARIGNIIIADDFSVFFNEYEDFKDVSPLGKDRLTTIDKILEKAGVIDNTNFCLKNVEKTPDNFQLIYFGKALLENGVEREEPYTLYYDSLSYVFSENIKAKYFSLKNGKIQKGSKPTSVERKAKYISGKEFFILTPYYQTEEPLNKAFEDSSGIAGDLLFVSFDEEPKAVEPTTESKRTEATSENIKIPTSQVFKTDNISRITFYSYYGSGKGSVVPKENMTEIINWLGSFKIDKKAPDILPPGTGTNCVEIEYSNGTVVKKALDYVMVDSVQYKTKSDNAPGCYWDILSKTSYTTDSDTGGVPTPKGKLVTSNTPPENTTSPEGYTTPYIDYFTPEGEHVYEYYVTE